MPPIEHDAAETALRLDSATKVKSEASGVVERPPCVPFVPRSSVVHLPNVNQ